MTATNNRGFIGRHALNEGEEGDVLRLASVCNAYEGLDLKLAVGGSASPSAQDMDKFLYYENGQLLGFCSLDYDELCGMVHPEHRRKGIGKALLTAALDEYRRRKIPEVLVICEEASRSGKEFLAPTGAKYDFAEHHMELEPGADWGVLAREDSSLTFSKAVPGDIAMLAHLTANALERDEEESKEHIMQDIDSENTWFYVGRLGQTPVTTLKAFAMDTKIGIYAFGMLPEYRGRGLGKQFFVQVIKELRSEGWTRFALEVETENSNAAGLYKSCGFEVTTTYGYYKLDL